MSNNTLIARVSNQRLPLPLVSPVHDCRSPPRQTSKSGHAASSSSKEVLAGLNPGPSGAIPLIHSMEQVESSPVSVDHNLGQSTSLDSASSVPILSSKLAARLKSIDGPVSLHLAADQVNLHPLAYTQLGKFGKASRPLLLARRRGSGRGGPNSVSK